MTDYTPVSLPSSNAPKDKLILLGYKTARDRIHPYRIKLACVYQWGDKSVLLMLGAHEPQYTLLSLTTIANHLTAVTIGVRFPVTWYIRKALWESNPAHGFNHSVYVYGGVNSWENSLK